jgi:hypothetical protein
MKPRPHRLAVNRMSKPLFSTHGGDESLTLTLHRCHVRTLFAGVIVVAALGFGLIFLDVYRAPATSRPKPRTTSFLHKICGRASIRGVVQARPYQMAISLQRRKAPSADALVGAIATFVPIKAFWQSGLVEMVAWAKNEDAGSWRGTVKLKCAENGVEVINEFLRAGQLILATLPDRSGLNDRPGEPVALIQQEGLVSFVESALHTGQQRDVSAQIDAFPRAGSTAAYSRVRTKTSSRYREPHSSRRTVQHFHMHVLTWITRRKPRCFAGTRCI